MKFTLKKSIASLLIFALIFTQSSVIQATPINTVIIETSALISDFISSNIVIPAQWGSVQHLQTGKGPMVFHIQTAHGIYDAQKNIQGILNYLHRTYGTKTLLLEGSSEKLHPEILRFFPNHMKETLQINDEIARHALVKGPELFLIENGDAVGYGIENHALYKKNLAAFKAVLNQQEKTRGFLSAMNEQIERLSSAHLSKDLRGFLALEDLYDSKRRNISDWLLDLNGLAMKHLGIKLTHPVQQIAWPMLYRYFTLGELQGKINLTAFQTERSEFLNLIKILLVSSPKSLVGDPPSGFPTKTFGNDKREVPVGGEAIYTQIESLLNRPLDQVLAPAPQAAYLFDQMAEILPGNFNYARFEHLNRVIASLILQSEIHPSALNQEISNLCASISQKLATTSQEKSVLDLVKDYRLLKKLFALELTAEEYEQIKAEDGRTGKKMEERDQKNPSSSVLFPFIPHSSLRPSFLLSRFAALNLEKRVKNVEFKHLAELDHLFDASIEFYRLVQARDGSMLQNIQEKLAQLKEPSVAIVTGGFHTGPFEEYFSKHGQNYVLIAPKISSTDKELQSGHENYIQTILQNLNLAKSTLESESLIALADAPEWLVRQAAEIAANSKVFNSALLAELGLKAGARPQEISSKILGHIRNARIRSEARTLALTGQEQIFQSPELALSRGKTTGGKKKLLELAQKHIDRISKGDRFSDHQLPNVFHVTDADLRTALEFSKKWRSIYESTSKMIPIVLTGGRGERLNQLISDILAPDSKLSFTIESKDRRWLEDALTNPNYSETHIMSWLLSKSGIPDERIPDLHGRLESAVNVFSLEPPPTSILRHKKFLNTTSIIERMMNGNANPVIAEVTRPDRLLSAKTTGTDIWVNKNKKGWKIKAYKTHSIDLRSFSDTQLISFLGSSLGYPDSYVQVHQNLKLWNFDRETEMLLPGWDGAHYEATRSAFKDFLDTLTLDYDPVRNHLVPVAARSEVRTDTPQDYFDIRGAKIFDYSEQTDGFLPVPLTNIIKKLRLSDIVFNLMKLIPEDKNILWMVAHAYFKGLKERHGKMTITKPSGGAASRMQKGMLPNFVIDAMKKQPDDFVDQQKLAEYKEEIAEKFQGDWKAFVRSLDVSKESDHSKLKHLVPEVKALLPAARSANGTYYSFIAFHLISVKQANDRFEKMDLGRPFIAQTMLNHNYYAKVIRNLARNRFFGLKVKLVNKNREALELTDDNLDQVYDVDHDDPESDFIIFNQPLVPRWAAGPAIVEKQWKEDQADMAKIATIQRQLRLLETGQEGDLLLGQHGVGATELREKLQEGENNLKAKIMMPNEAAYQYALTFAHANGGKPLRNPKALAPGGHGWYHIAKLLSDPLYRTTPAIVTARRRNVEYDDVSNIDNMAVLNDDILLMLGHMIKNHITFLLEASKKPSTERGSGGGAFIWSLVHGSLQWIQLEFALIKASLGDNPQTKQPVSPDFNAESQESMDAGLDKVPVNNASMLHLLHQTYEGLVGKEAFNKALEAGLQGNYQLLSDLSGPMQDALGSGLTLKPIKDPTAKNPNPDDIILTVIAENWMWDAQKGHTKKEVAMTASMVEIEEGTEGVAEESVRFDPLKDLLAYTHAVGMRVREAIFRRIYEGRLFTGFEDAKKNNFSPSEVKSEDPPSRVRSFREGFLAELISDPTLKDGGLVSEWKHRVSGLTKGLQDAKQEGIQVDNGVFTEQQTSYWHYQREYNKALKSLTEFLADRLGKSVLESFSPDDIVNEILNPLFEGMGFKGKPQFNEKNTRALANAMKTAKPTSLTETHFAEEPVYSAYRLEPQLANLAEMTYEVTLKKPVPVHNFNELAITKISLKKTPESGFWTIEIYAHNLVSPLLTLTQIETGYRAAGQGSTFWIDDEVKTIVSIITDLQLIRSEVRLRLPADISADIERRLPPNDRTRNLDLAGRDLTSTAHFDAKGIWKRFGKSEETLPQGSVSRGDLAGFYGNSSILFLDPTIAMRSKITELRSRLENLAAFKNNKIRMYPDDAIHYTLGAFPEIHQAAPMSAEAQERNLAQLRLLAQNQTGFNLYARGLTVDESSMIVIQGFLGDGFEQLEDQFTQAQMRKRHYPRVDFSFGIIIEPLTPEEKSELQTFLNQSADFEMGLREVTSIDYVHHQNDMLIDNLRRETIPLAGTKRRAEIRFSNPTIPTLTELQSRKSQFPAFANQPAFIGELRAFAAPVSVPPNSVVEGLRKILGEKAYQAGMSAIGTPVEGTQLADIVPGNGTPIINQQFIGNLARQIKETPSFAKNGVGNVLVSLDLLSALSRENPKAFAQLVQSFASLQIELGVSEPILTTILPKGSVNPWKGSAIHGIYTQVGESVEQASDHFVRNQKFGVVHLNLESLSSLLAPAQLSLGKKLTGEAWMAAVFVALESSRLATSLRGLEPSELKEMVGNFVSRFLPGFTPAGNGSYILDSIQELLVRSEIRKAVDRAA
ncbi:MAG: hypothetical protein EXS63_07905 [Candidatus Omnitrophica bacterium]|nr:hypothetical protein [Candidatus Omnitrophota bacterium]